MTRIDFRKLDLRDALDLAILIEEDAKERYEEFTRIVGGRYRGDASDVFRMMASNEAKHGAQLLERRRELFQDQPRRVNREMIEETEAPDRGKPRTFMSARQAVEVAISSEEKAHDFFDAAAREVTDPEVKRLFEDLRAEEADHRRLLARRLQDYAPGPDVEEDEADEPGSDGG
ncbi:MAG TPA: ferritin family protein [Anaeromyxobacteraceae bacterium]|nr:ferritin family protein [Anaeromyxobacteraceae bacterium]